MMAKDLTSEQGELERQLSRLDFDLWCAMVGQSVELGGAFIVSGIRDGCQEEPSEPAIFRCGVGAMRER